MDPSLDKENTSPNDNANEVPLEQNESTITAADAIQSTVSSSKPPSPSKPSSPSKPPQVPRAEVPAATTPTAPVVSDSSWKCGTATPAVVCVFMI